MIRKEQLGNAMGYEAYRRLQEDLLREGKTTGHEQSEEKIGYAKLNLQRMTRLDKTIRLEETLKKALAEVKEKFIWLVITEGWCGDAAQNIPLFHIAARESGNIELKLLLRDDNPEVMDMCLTNGARSIPVLVCLRADTLGTVFTWGPRPAPLQEKVKAILKEPGGRERKGLMVQQWYNADKTLTQQRELLALIRAHMLP